MSFLRAALFAFIAVFATGASCARNASAADETTLVIETGESAHRFTVEIANDDRELSQGLMYRRALADDAGMLFDFGPTPQPVSMWMKNTLIPLDMAFIRADGTIAKIAAETTPKSLTSIHSDEDVVAVLEVRGGRLGELGVEAGDRIRHSWFQQN